MPADQAEVAVTLDPGGSVLGHVLDAQGKPVAAAIIASTGTPEGRREVEVGDDGNYQLHGLAAGSYTVRPMPRDFGQAQGNAWLAPKRIELAAGATVRADFEATAGGSALTVQITTSSGGRALGQALLVPGTAAAPSNPADLRRLLGQGIRASRDDAGFSFKGLAAGHYTLMFLAMQGQAFGIYVQGVEVDGHTDVSLPVALPDQLPTVSFN